MSFVTVGTHRSLCSKQVRGLWDFNSAVEAIAHRFQVAVYYDVDGKLYSTDPVIVNEPPSG